LESFRKKIAKNISNIDNPEIYQLNPWLNSFPVNECGIENLLESVNRFNSVNTQILAPKAPYEIFFYNEKNNNKNTCITFEKLQIFLFSCQINKQETDFIEFSLFNFYIKKYDLFTFITKDEISDIKLKKLKVLVYKVDFPQDYVSNKTEKIIFTENVSENLINDFVSDVLYQKVSSVNNIKEESKKRHLEHKLQVNISGKEIQNEKNQKNKSLFFIPEENLIADPVYNLEPVYDLKSELKEEMLSNLPDFQKKGAEFLYKNDFVFFNDTFELGKETQAATALRMLLRTRKIQKVLIVTNEYNEQIYRQTQLICLKGLWESILEISLNEYDFKFHQNLSNFEKKNIFSNYVINGISYNTFENSFSNGLFSYEKINLFDCIIFDDTTYKNLQYGYITLLETNSYKNKLWFLSEFSSEGLSEKITSLFPERKLACFGRKASQISETNTKTYVFDYYLPFEENNMPIDDKYIFLEESVTENDISNSSKMTKFIKEFQKQQPYCKNLRHCNKTGLLVHHLKRILDRNNKVLVYTQANSNKIDEIEKILIKYNFNYIKFDQFDKDLNLAKKFEEFENFYKKVVYLTNLDPHTTSFVFPDTSHVINFNNSWNPLNRWQIEKNVENPIVVYNYFYKNSIEQELVSELQVKGLFDRNLIKALSSEKLYQIINSQNFKNIFAETVKIENIIELLYLTKQLLTKLGYDKINAKAAKVNFIYDLEVKSSAINYCLIIKLVYSNNLDSRKINNIISEKKSEKPLIIITNSTISHSKLLLPPDVSLINGKLLLNYLNLFKTI